MNMNLDVVGLAMSMSQQKVMSSVGAALLSNALDNTESMGANMASMINSAPAPSLESMVNPNMGTAIDMTV